MNLITLVNSRRWQKDYLGIDLPTTPFYQILGETSNIELFEIEYQILGETSNIELFEIEYQILGETSNIELFEIEYQILNKTEVKIEI